jgi:nicotinamidase-related amidase
VATADHAWSIPAREYERHESRRGQRFAYSRLTARTTALVVVDMVRFFADNPCFRGIVPRINRLAGEVRDCGGVVAWVVPEQAEPTPWAVEFYGAEVARAYADSGGSGAITDRLASGLSVGESDVMAEKSAPSAFFPGRSTLPGALEERGIDTVLITGTVTNVCCESSVRDAATLGYRTVLVADACATVDDDAHNTALRIVYRSFGDDARPTN